MATLSYRDLAMDRIRHVVTRNGDLVELTFTEFSLLEQLLLHATEAVTRNDLLQRVWAGRMDPDSNVVDVHMANLRRKLDRKGGERLIHTVRGVGYILQLEPQQEKTERAPHRAADHAGRPRDAYRCHPSDLPLCAHHTFRET